MRHIGRRAAPCIRDNPGQNSRRRLQQI